MTVCPMDALVDDHLRRGCDDDIGSRDDGDFLSEFDWDDGLGVVGEGDGVDDSLADAHPPQVQPAPKRAAAPECSPVPGVGDDDKDDAGGLRRTRGGAKRCAPPHRHALASSASASAVPHLLEFVSSAGPLPWNVERCITPQEEEREWARTTPDEMEEIRRDLTGMSISGRGSGGGGGGGGGFGNVAARSMYRGSAGSGDVVVSSCGQGSMAGAALLGSCTVGGGVGADGTHCTRPPSEPMFTDDKREEMLLPAMEAEIEAIPDEEKGAYLEALQQCPELTRDVRHRKAFVWREDFNAKRAAKRFVAYWEYRRELFGPRRCFLPMTLSGAVADDMVALSARVIQLLPERDEHGRSIVFFSFARLDTSSYSRESMVRAFWYIMHVAIEDPDTRRRGVVALFDGYSKSFRPFDPILYRRLVDVGRRCHTFRFRALHYFRPGPLFHLLNPVLKAIWPERLRKRFVTHFGSTDAVLRSVDAFGLHKGCLPSALGGDVPELDPVKWLSARMILEGLLSRTSPAGSDGAVLECDSVHGLSEEPKKIATGEVKSMAAVPMCGKFKNGGTNEAAPLTDSPGPAPCATVEPSSSDTPSSPPSTTMSDGGGTALVTDGEKEEKKKKKGWRDPRMERAVEAKAANSELTLLDALIVGGFGFSADKSKALTDKLIKDESDGVSLFQRKNQLCRRLRRRKADEAKLESVNTTERTSQAATQANCRTSEDVDPRADTEAESCRCANETRGSSMPLWKAGKTSHETNTAERGDPRMLRAVEAKSANPQMSLLDALIDGGFDFPRTKKRGETDKTVHDSEGVSLSQRKNQLRRRLRLKRPDDPRMSRAVAARLQNPDIPVIDALVEGGFKFPKLGVPGSSEETIVDTDKVKLSSRKNELLKKLAEVQSLAESDKIANADYHTSSNGASCILPEKESQRPRQTLTEHSSKMMLSVEPASPKGVSTVDESGDLQCRSNRLNTGLNTDDSVHKKHANKEESRQRKIQNLRSGPCKDIRRDDLLCCPEMERNDFSNPLVKHFGQEQPLINSLFWGAEDNM